MLLDVHRHEILLVRGMKNVRHACRHQDLLLGAALAGAEQGAGDGASEIAALRDGAREAAGRGVCKAEEPGLHAAHPLTTMSVIVLFQYQSRPVHSFLITP